MYAQRRNCSDYNDIWAAVVERIHRCAKAPLITGQQWARIIFLDNIIMKTASSWLASGTVGGDGGGSFVTPFLSLVSPTLPFRHKSSRLLSNSG